MTTTSVPHYSIAALSKALIMAIAAATLVFMTIILPAEYQSDPTGVGKMLGLMVLSEDRSAAITSQVATPQTSLQNSVTTAPFDMFADSTVPTTAANRQKDNTTITVPAKRGVEYKFRMNKHAEIIYQWQTDQGELYFDFHGEPKGDTTGYFKSYTLATATQMKGAMTVPFDGVHGWYFKNTGDKPIKVTLNTQGDFEVIGLMH